MSRKIWNSVVVLGLAVVAASVAGCGGVSSAQKADAGNVAGGLAGVMANPNGTSLTAGSADSGLGELSSTVHGLYWWSRFAAESKALDAKNMALSGGTTSDLTFASCPVSTTATTGAKTGDSCKGSCNAALTSMTETCTIPDGTKEACNNVTYTFSGVSVSATIDMSGVTVTGSTPTGNLGFSLNIGATITGGSLTNNVFACNLSTTISLTATTAPAIDCNSFTCTLDGKKISCDDMTKNMGQAGCAKTP